MPTTPIWSKISDLKPFELYDLDPGGIFRKIYWVSSDAQTVIAVRRRENILKEYIRNNNNEWTVKTNYNIVLWPTRPLDLPNNPKEVDSLENDYYIYISKLKTKIVIFEKTSYPDYPETPGVPSYTDRYYFRVLIYNINSNNTLTLSNTINPSKNMLPPRAYFGGVDTYTNRRAPTFSPWNFVMSDNGNIMILIEVQNSVLSISDNFTAWNVMLSINGGITFSTLLGGHDTQGNNTSNFSGYSITKTITTTQFEPYITDNGIFLHYGTKSIGSNRYYLYKINANINTIELVDFKKFNASAGLGTYYIDWNNTSNGLPVDLSTPKNRTIKSISQNGSTLYASFTYVDKNSSKEVGKVGAPSSYGSSGGLDISDSNAPNGTDYFYNGSSSVNKLTVCNDIGDKYFAVTKDYLNDASAAETPIVLWYFENYGKTTSKQIRLYITDDTLKPYIPYFWGKNIKLYWLNQNTIILSYTIEPGNIHKTRILYTGAIQTTPLPLPTRTPFPTRTPAPTPTRTLIPVPTRTPAPTPTRTLAPIPTSTPIQTIGITPTITTTAIPPTTSPTTPTTSLTDSELFFRKNGEYKFYENTIPNNSNEIIQQQASYSINFNNPNNTFNGVSANDLSNRRNFSYIFNDPGPFAQQYKPLSYIFQGYGKKPYLNNDVFMYLYQGGEDAIIIRLPIESYITFLYLHPAFGGTSDIGSVTYDIRLDSNRLIKTGWPNSSISVMSDNDNSWRVINPKLHDTNYIMGPNYIPINQVCKYIKIQKLSYELNNNSTNYGLLLLKGLAPLFGALPTPTPSLPVSPTPTPSSTNIIKTCLDSSSGGPTYQTYFVVGNTIGSVIGSNASGYSCSTMLGCDSTTGSQIDPISLGAAAVHAGLLLNNTAGTIYIINDGWKSSFTGSISNGVSSRSSSIGSCSVKLSLGPTVTPTSTPTRTPTPTSTQIITTPTPTVPDNINRQVRNLTVRGGNETVYVSFDAPINTNPSVFVGYRIYYAIGLNGSWIDVTSQITKSDGIYSPYGDSIPYTDVNNNVISRMNISFNLPNGHDYAIKVAAGYNVTGYSKWSPKLYDVVSSTRTYLAPNIQTELSANTSITTWYGLPAIQFSINSNVNTSNLNIFSDNIYTPLLDSYNFDTKVIDGTTLQEYLLQDLINTSNVDTFTNPPINFIQPNKHYYITFNRYSASYKLSFKVKNILYAKTVSSLGDTHKTVYKQTSVVYNLNAPTPTSTPSSTPTRTPGPTPTKTTTPTSTPVPTATPRVIIESATSSLAPNFDIEYVRNSSTGDLDAIIKIIPISNLQSNKKTTPQIIPRPPLPPSIKLGNIYDVSGQPCYGGYTSPYYDNYTDNSVMSDYGLDSMTISFYKTNNSTNPISILYNGIQRSVFEAIRQGSDENLSPIYTLKLTRKQLLSLIHTDFGNGVYKIYAKITANYLSLKRAYIKISYVFPACNKLPWTETSTAYHENTINANNIRTIYRNITMPIQSTFNSNQIWLNYGQFLITDNLVSFDNPLGNIFRSISPLDPDGNRLINGSGFDANSCYDCWGYGVSSSSLSSIIDLGSVLNVSSIVFLPYSNTLEYWVPKAYTFGDTGVVCEISNDGITWLPISFVFSLISPSFTSDNVIDIKQQCRYIRLKTNGPGRIVLKKFKPIL